MTRLLRRRRGQDGAVAAEFALLVPVAFLLIGFGIALGLRGLFAATTEYVARDVARYGAIQRSGAYADPAQLQARAQGSVNGLMGGATVTAVYGQTTPGARLGEGDTLTLTVTAPVPGVSALRALTGSLGLDFLTSVTQSATVRLE